MLPTLIDEVSDEELKGALSQHLDETRFHVSRVEEAFVAAGGEPTAARSAALAGLKEQHDSQEPKEPTLTDLFHAAGAARSEHLELGLYGSLLGLAQTLGHDQAHELLEQNQRDEKQALEALGKIAARLRGELPT